LKGISKSYFSKALKETGDDPDDVQCIYSTGFLPNIPGVDPPEQKCLASDLPEGELSVLSCYSKKHRYKLVRKGPQIETSIRKAWRDERD